VITVPERRAGETLLDYLQRKEEAFGLWQAGGHAGHTIAGNAAIISAIVG